MVYHASSLNKEQLLKTRNKLLKEGRKVTMPYRNRLNGQWVWTIRYSGNKPKWGRTY